MSGAGTIYGLQKFQTMITIVGKWKRLSAGGRSGSMQAHEKAGNNAWRVHCLAVALPRGRRKWHASRLPRLAREFYKRKAASSQSLPSPASPADDSIRAQYRKMLHELARNRVGKFARAAMAAGCRFMQLAAVSWISPLLAFASIIQPGMCAPVVVISRHRKGVLFGLDTGRH